MKKQLAYNISMLILLTIAFVFNFSFHDTFKSNFIAGTLGACIGNFIAQIMLTTKFTIHQEIETQEYGKVVVSDIYTSTIYTEIEPVYELIDPVSSTKYLSQESDITLFTQPT